jgi:hypothetical protein
MGLSADLWHDPDHVAYATIDIGTHREHHAIRSSAFQRWLLAEFGRRHPRTIGDRTIPSAPAAQAKADALNALEAVAAEGREQCPVVRLGEAAGKFYLDRGTPTWEAAEIDAEGWRVVAEAPVPFLRPTGVRPLPVPVTGGSINELRDLLNVDTENDFRLVVSILVSMLRRQGPFPVLIVSGEQGAAKSTFCKVLRRLVDPNHAELRTAPRSEQDLLVAARNSWVVGLDNLSFVNADLSDAICRLATGGGFSTRKLYTDGEEYRIDVCRPVILNGIPSLAARPDLADRSIVLTLPPIADSQRRTEAEFWAEFNQRARYILGALLDAASAGLKNLPTTRLSCRPRMADFAQWAVAAAPACGWHGQDFLDAYTGNRQAAVENTVEADAVAVVVRALAEEDPEGWSGTGAGLLAEINRRTDMTLQREKGWPRNAQRLADRLRRAQPGLRRLGTGVDLDRKHSRTRRKIITIKKEPASQPSQPSQACEINHLAAKPEAMASLRSDGPAFAAADPAKAVESVANAAEGSSLRSNLLILNSSKAAKPAKANLAPLSSREQYELMDVLGTTAVADISAELTHEQSGTPLAGEEVLI